MINVNIRNEICIYSACRRLALEVSDRLFLLGVCFILFCIATAQAQSVETRPAIGQSIKYLNIGDQIPDELWNLPLQVVNHPQGKETITLADHKGKLIILDFWATWCSPCIRNFPKIHALQNEFGDKIKVLAVTPQDIDVINKFFKTEVGKDLTYVTSVVQDSILSEYFPFICVPHLVWINPAGILLNTTRADEVTHANIQSIVDNKNIRMVTKKYIDPNNPLFLSEYLIDGLHIQAFSIFTKRDYPGLPSGNVFRRTKDGKVYGRQITNAPILDIYYAVINELFNKSGEQFNLKRLLIDVKEPALLNVIEKEDGEYEKHNLYNYELIIPEQKADSLYHYMLTDLNRYSDYIGSIEKREVDCFVLIRTSTKDKIKSKGGKPKTSFSPTHAHLINRPIGHIVNMANGDTLTKLPIIDETGYTDNVDVEINGFKDFTNFRKELNKYDLDLIPAKRSLNMFVIKDK